MRFTEAVIIATMMLSCLVKDLLINASRLFKKIVLVELVQTTTSNMTPMMVIATAVLMKTFQIMVHTLCITQLLLQVFPKLLTNSQNSNTDMDVAMTLSWTTRALLRSVQLKFWRVSTAVNVATSTSSTIQMMETVIAAEMKISKVSHHTMSINLKYKHKM
jgi:hypothetical protein